jgi:hypothetical protein
LLMLLCISSPRRFFYSSWWCVDAKANNEETLGYRSSPRIFGSSASTSFLVEPCSLSIAYVDSDIAGKRVGEFDTQVVSWHWPGAVELILPIVTSIIDKSIFLIIHAAFASQPHPSWKIWKLCGCPVEQNGDGCLYAGNVTPFFDKNTAPGWVIVVTQ